MVINAQSGLFTQNISPQSSEGVTQPVVERYQMSSQRYHTDKEGNILMFVNVWGHVNSPGSHLVYDGIDLATLLSMVGGPRPGANLKKVRLFREIPDENGLVTYDLDLSIFYKSGNRDNFIEIKPNDTIIFPQTSTSYILSYAGTVNTFLQIINLYFQVESRK
jgi:hypothetical protein